jgi:hypothetical protein
MTVSDIILYLSVIFIIVMSIMYIFTSSSTYKYDTPEEFVHANIEILNKIAEGVINGDLRTVYRRDINSIKWKNKTKINLLYSMTVNFLNENGIEYIITESSGKKEDKKFIIEIKVEESMSIFVVKTYFIVYAKEESDIYNLTYWQDRRVRSCRNIQGFWYFCEILYY